MHEQLPLSGIRVVENASGVAAAYAGRLLAAMGADKVIARARESAADMLEAAVSDIVFEEIGRASCRERV